MNSLEFTIRPAQPTREEGLCFARYMNMTAEGQFRLLFGPRLEEIIAAAYCSPNHDLSYERTVFAEVDHRIVGLASGYTEAQHRRSSYGPLRHAAGRSAFRILCTSALASPILRFLHTYERGDFYLQFLAVDGDCRGQGIGSRLIQSMEERARQSGSARFALDVSARNEGARRLYERRGLVQSAQWPRLRLLPPAIYRMVKLV
jgi:ribosomal protein S18 acetylase RimI-like enzyme